MSDYDALVERLQNSAEDDLQACDTLGDHDVCDFSLDAALKNEAADALASLLEENRRLAVLRDLWRPCRACHGTGCDYCEFVGFVLMGPEGDETFAAFYKRVQDTFAAALASPPVQEREEEGTP